MSGHRPTPGNHRLQGTPSAKISLISYQTHPVCPLPALKDMCCIQLFGFKWITDWFMPAPVKVRGRVISCLFIGVLLLIFRKKTNRGKFLCMKTGFSVGNEPRHLMTEARRCTACACPGREHAKRRRRCRKAGAGSRAIQREYPGINPEAASCTYRRRRSPFCRYRTGCWKRT